MFTGHGLASLVLSQWKYYCVTDGSAIRDTAFARISDALALTKFFNVSVYLIIDRVAPTHLRSSSEIHQSGESYSTRHLIFSSLRISAT